MHLRCLQAMNKTQNMMLYVGFKPTQINVEVNDKNDCNLSKYEEMFPAAEVHTTDKSKK